MSNSMLNISMITNESLRLLKNELGFSKGVNRQYDDQFAKSGAKIGSVINIRKPVRYEVTNGASLSLQDVEDQSAALTLDSQKHVGFTFTSKEMALNIDEFSERYLKPAISALANKIDYDGLQLAKTAVYNSVGTPGTQPATQADAIALALSAGQKLSEMGCPIDGRSMVVNPASQAAMVKGLAGLFHAQSQLNKQYEKGSMFDALGFKWKMDQNVAMHTTGQLGGTPTVKTTITAQGATSIESQAWTASAANRLKAGDVFTIADVYAVNPQTRESTGSLQQFVVTANADSDGSGDATISFSPAIYSSGAYQNVNSLPQSSAAILIFGHASSYASKLTPTNIAYHKDAFVLGMADLALPKGIDMAARAVDPDAGLSVRIVRDYDIVNDRFPCRVDVLYGWKTVYAELACRVHG